MYFRFTNDQSPLPTNGPNSHPAAPQAIVEIPRTTIGSNPITCAPSDSISWVDRYCTPKTVVTTEVTADDATEYLRRVARSLKNEFQSNLASFIGGAEEVEFARTVVRSTHEAGIELFCGRKLVWRSIEG